MPYTDQREVEEVAAVLASGYLTQGSKVAQFERLIGGLIGSRHTFAVSSCTTALHLSLVALGIAPGDEVLVPDFTFPATANVVVQQGARPVLVDVRADTFCLDVADLAGRITSRSRAIIPVHAFGLSADMDAVLALAREYNLAVVEDAACALGSRYHGRACGTLGDLGCFSFHPRKSITTAEGGLIATNRDDLADRIAVLRNHGGVRGEYYYRFEEAGFNYRMSDVHAAIGIAQMEKWEGIIERKRALVQRYRDLLKGVVGVTPPQEPQGYYHTYQSYVITLDEGIDRDRLIAAMREHRVETTLGTYALHVQPYFQRTYGYRTGDLPNSYRLFRQSLALPLYPQMRADEMEQVVWVLRKCLQQAG